MGNKINQDAFIRLLAKKTDIQIKDLNFVWQSALDLITELLKEDSEIRFARFGKFKLKKYDEYEGTNPRTREKMMMKPLDTPVFKCAKNLKNAVNEIADT